jgi:hypothetical protein
MISVLYSSAILADDNETAEARHIAEHLSTNLMLKTMFEIIATMADDPAGYRSDLKKEMLEIAGAMKLGPMPQTQETKVRGFVRETIDELLSHPLAN